MNDAARWSEIKHYVLEQDPALAEVWPRIVETATAAHAGQYRNNGRSPDRTFLT